MQEPREEGPTTQKHVYSIMIPLVFFLKVKIQFTYNGKREIPEISVTVGLRL